MSTQTQVQSQTDYIYEPNFLDHETCEKLVNHIQKTLIPTNQNTNQNPAFDNRVVYWEHITDPEIRQIMKRIQEQVREKLQNFYQLDDQTLYPEATHLVKWPTGSALGLHADNSFVNEKGEFTESNYVPWRTHSAVIYLNDNYEGGHFFFHKQLPQTMKPQTGLLVGFTAGMNHVHGVQQVTSATRYAMPMWFTQDPQRAYPQYR